MDPLEKQRNHIIDQLREFGRLRRGQISEQYIEKPGADGKMKRFGPYYVWQATIQGEKRSVRIPRDQVEEVRKDLQGYKEFKDLCQQLAAITEEITCRETPGGKKNVTQSSRRLPKK